MGSHGVRFALAGAIGALALAALGPGVAEANLSCARAGAVLNVDMTAPGDAAHLALSGQNIQLRDKTFSTVACTNAPTVLNVDTIDVDDTSTGSTTVDVDDAHAYAPGASDAGDDAGALTNEIEFDVNLGAGAADTLRLATDSSGGGIFWGSTGINPNAAAAEQGPDADITTTGVEVNEGSGSFGSQTLSGAGGQGTGGAFARRLELSGGFDDDLIEGGSGGDDVDGSFGDDIVRGGAGNDEVGGSFGADDVSGGSGIDTAAYRISCASDENDCSVKVNLADNGFVDGGSADESDVTPGKRDDVGSDVENISGAPTTTP